MFDTTTTREAEAQCREFAAQHPTANVRKAIALCESGRLSWVEVYALFHRSLTAGLAAVR